MGLMMMDRSMFITGVISLLIGVYVALNGSLPASYPYHLSDSIAAGLLFAAGVVLAVYGLLKKGAPPPPPPS